MILIFSQVLWVSDWRKGAVFFCSVKTAKMFSRPSDFVEEHHPERIFICGQGSNLIFTDDYFDGVVIQIGAATKPQISFSDDLATAFAGETLDSLIQLGFHHNLTGLEWAGGLPGTVGAGVRGNVGAFGGEIKDRLVAAEVLQFDDKNIDVLEMKNENFHFSYRHSIVKEKRNMIVTAAQFQLINANREEVIKARHVFMRNSDYRKMHHPLEYPNCGSVFKNIKKPNEVAKIVDVWPEIRTLVKEKWHGKVSMGYIINRLGFSGYTIGNAKVSEKHANFINNLGGATAKDVLTIIKRIQEMTEETFAIIPEVEVEIVK